MLLHRLTMSSFQPINKPKKMSKPAMGNNSSAPAVVTTHGPESLLAFEVCPPDLTQTSSSRAEPCEEKKTKSPKVVMPGNGLQESRLSEASQCPQTPPQKKKKKRRGTAKALRKQADRAVKPMTTVEHSATTSSTDTASTPSTGPESDSNWSTASTHLGELESDMSPQTPHGLHGRSSRHRPRSLSPANYDEVIREKMPEEEVAEACFTELVYQQYMRIKGEKRKDVPAMRMKKRMKRLLNELRKEKGKEPGHKLEKTSSMTSHAPSKRKRIEEQETKKTPKRQKKSHKKMDEEPLAGLPPMPNPSSPSEHTLVDSCRYQSGKSTLSGKRAKVMIHEGSQDSQPETVALQTTSKGLFRGPEKAAPKGNESSTTRAKHSDNVVPPQRSTTPGCIPTGPKAWLAEQTQIARDREQACVTNASPNRAGQRNKGLSSKQIARGRKQSSIDPKRFYGKQPAYRVPQDSESSPTMTYNALTNENKDGNAERSENTEDRITPPDSSPSSGSKISRKSSSARVPFEPHIENDWQPVFDDDDTMFPTPKSSPTNQDVGSAGPSRDHASPLHSNHGVMDVRTKPRPETFRKDQPAPTVPENKLGQRLSGEVPESHKGRAQPPKSFDAQRRRHQSMPANLTSRIVNESEVSSQPAQRGHDHALQELSNNVGGLEKKFTSLEKVVLERLLAPPSTQIAASQAATAATVIVTAGTRGGNGAERSNSRKKKNASVAERQLTRPILDRNVPPEHRLPDEELIEIGRKEKSNHYERHQSAPYAFSWYGYLWEDYKYLLDRRDNGEPVWTEAEIRRVKRL